MQSVASNVRSGQSGVRLALVGDDRAMTAPSSAAKAAAGMSIKVDEVSKSFVSRSGTVVALGSVSLDIRPGEFVSVVGPSGCGKSTLLNLIAGLMSPSKGTISIGERRVSGPYTDLGIVFQRDLLMEWRTALDNVLLQIAMRG